MTVSELQVKMPEYSMQEVAAHKAKGDVWIVIHGKVFDITHYIQDHPGGADVLLDTAGADATTEYEDVGHSEDASEIMEQFQVGTLKYAQQYVVPKVVRVVSQEAPKNSKSSNNAGLVIGALGAMLPILYTCSLGNNRLAQSLDALSRVVPHQLKDLGQSRSGFLNGFLAASVISGVIGVMVVQQVSRFTNIESGFVRYSPHVKVKPMVRADPHLARGFLTQQYQSLPLVEKELVSPNVFRFVFALPTAKDVLGLPIGQHVAIKAVIDGLTVTRSYTPVSNNLDRGRLELVVKSYENGLLSKYLASLDIGAEVDFRGPKGSMRYTPNLCRKIGMVAGGTGITPMYQLIRAICENDTDTTEISLIYANCAESDILLRKELETFARRYPKNLKLWYMLDSAPTGWTYGTGYVDQTTLVERLPSPAADTRIVLCGPPGFIHATKENLGALGFQKPGTVSKMGDEIFCF